MRIDQLLPSISFGDAVSNSAVIIKQILESHGIKSNIYAGHIHPKMRKHAMHRDRLSASADAIIYHMATGAEESYIIKNIDIRKKIMIYHNITPSIYFKGYSIIAEKSVIRGRKELRMLKDEIGLAIGVSEYNRQELVKIGYPNTAVVPFIVNFDDYSQKPSTKVLREMNDGKVNFLFVGRICPHKKQEDIIKTFYCYHKYFNPNSRLVLVGGYHGMETYYYQLVNLINELEIEDHVIITGHIPFPDILAYYHSAHLFICMSEHEGFCVPLLEAMYFKLPILAYDSSAVGETLGDGGVLFKEKDFVSVAAMADKIISDKNFYNALKKKSEERLKVFDQKRLEELLYKTLIDFMYE